MCTMRTTLAKLILFASVFVLPSIARCKPSSDIQTIQESLAYLQVLSQQTNGASEQDKLLDQELTVHRSVVALLKNAPASYLKEIAALYSSIVNAHKRAVVIIERYITKHVQPASNYEHEELSHVLSLISFMQLTDKILYQCKKSKEYSAQTADFCNNSYIKEIVARAITLYELRQEYVYNEAVLNHALNEQQGHDARAEMQRIRKDITALEDYRYFIPDSSKQPSVMPFTKQTPTTYTITTKPKKKIGFPWRATLSITAGCVATGLIIYLIVKLVQKVRAKTDRRIEDDEIFRRRDYQRRDGTYVGPTVVHNHLGGPTVPYPVPYQPQAFLGGTGYHHRNRHSPITFARLTYPPSSASTSLTLVRPRPAPYTYPATTTQPLAYSGAPAARPELPQIANSLSTAAHERVRSVRDLL